jgi:hypothetical protein
MVGRCPPINFIFEADWDFLEQCTHWAEKMVTERTCAEPGRGSRGHIRRRESNKRITTSKILTATFAFERHSRLRDLGCARSPAPINFIFEADWDFLEQCTHWAEKMVTELTCTGPGRGSRRRVFPPKRSAFFTLIAPLQPSPLRPLRV